MDAAQLEAVGPLEGVEGETARARRLELLRRLLADGFRVDELQEAVRTERLALLPVDRVLQREDAHYTRVQLAELSGLALEFLSRLWRALGMADPGDDEVVFGEPELEAVKLIAAFRAAGLDEDTLGLIAQVLGHGMTRLSETILQSVGEALLETGDSEQTLGLRYAQAAEHLIPMLTPLLGYVLGVQFKDQVKRSFVKPTELSAGQFENARDVTANGRAVPESGDWFGAPVNLASRVTDVAQPASVLSTEAVRDAFQPSFSWSYAGRRRLKGIAAPVALYRVRAN
jgi:class 3 adenylate cyclase